jgi:uridine kinase
MNEMLNITVNGTVKQYPKGTTLLEISKEHADKYEDDIILAYRDGRLRELFKTVQKDCLVDFITTADDTGHKTYQRGLILVMLKAIYGELGREIIKKVLIEYSIGSGNFCRIEGVGELTDEMINKIKNKMQQIINDDIPFEKRVIGTNEARELFHYYKMYDKEKLFRYRRVSTANIYSLAGFEDYFYGYMPASTGILKYFDIIRYDDGFILMLPEKNKPKVITPFVPQPKLYATLKQSNMWGKAMEIETVGDLNEEITKGGINDLILVQEALQEKKIAQIAELIKEAGNRKFVMIAGPSSSGKTTFSHRLSIQLRTYGLKPHPIAVDDYFVNRDLTPIDKEGKPNFETLAAVDVEQFNKDMTDLLNGKTVELPTYNFKTGRREYKGNYKTLGKDDILVIEGIHGLNDKLSYSLPRESKFKIYISALTQLNIDEHNRIPTTDGRLIRRLVRDARTRGTSAKETIAMWPSVRRGEEENIFPFQEEADVMFNSALIYELCLLKQYAEPILFGIDRECEEYQEAKRLLKFLDYFLGVSSEDIPKNSILREFIGGSCFKV